MKSRILQTLLAGGLLAAMGGGCATGPGATRTAGGAPAGPFQPAQEVELTGSYLKQRVARNGFITDGAGQVLVIDQQAIQRSGARDVREILVKYGLKR